MRIKEIPPVELASAPDDVLIAWNFIRIREGLCLTQAKAAEVGDVSTGYIGKVETAAVSFGTKAQQKWSRIFNIDRTEFLKRPDAGVAVVGVIADRGAVIKHPAEHEIERLPSLPTHAPDKVFCLKVSTDALYPYLRRSSYLYILMVPISTVRNDDFVVYVENDGSGAIKEVEWLGKGRLLFKGLGRGTTITEEVDEGTAVEKVVLISM
jgi:transcriptional regulator with XRE-family HTH domain